MTDMIDVNFNRNCSERLKSKYIKANTNTNTDMHLHIPILAMISSRITSVLELGVRDIQSTWGFLAGLSQESFGYYIVKNPHKLEFISQRKLVSVDLFNPADQGANINEVYEIAKENDVDFEFIQGNTLDIELEENFDCVFFDTDHTYEQLSAELKKYGPKTNTWMIFHDTARFGKVLIPAINEFLEEHKEWIIVPNMSTNKCNGLTVLAKTTAEAWEATNGQPYKNLCGFPL
jgi:hypothetical protein